MVNFQDPNVVASETCTNALQSHNVIPGLKNSALTGAVQKFWHALAGLYMCVCLPPSPEYWALTDS